jgi:lipid-A-disaccharide synthase-like uncharacterized protein
MKKRFKWEPPALMALVLLLGVWLVVAPGRIKGREGAREIDVRVGSSRGIVEVYRPTADATPEFRVLLRNGFTGPTLSGDEFRRQYGDEVYETATGASANWLFRIFNITSWASLVWVVIGFAGQIAFSGRMLLQWFVRERKRESVIPEAFWWLSLIGGVALFAYFVWRQDIVGVLGQSSGLVIYARNIRLIYKQRKRALEAAEQPAGGT